MANHESSIKRVRANSAKRLRNRYQLKSCRTVIKKCHATEELDKKGNLIRTATALLDKLAKTGVLHKNAVARKKSQLSRSISLNIV